MTKPDRRIQRTHELLQQALVDLLHDRRYNAITVQDIAERANVGRTTFYLHFQSKDDLLLHCHEMIVSAFQSGPRYPRSRDALLAPEPPPDVIEAYQHLQDARVPLRRLFQSKDSLLMLENLRDWCAEDIEASVRAAFAGVDSSTPIELPAHHLAGAQITLLHWWLGQS